MSRRTRKSSRPVLGRSARPRERVLSGPEILTGFGHVGRETLAAIAEELQAAGREDPATPEAVSALTRAQSGPEILVRETFVGRETLGAIATELRYDAPRDPMTTKPYGDRISNAPGSQSPVAKRRDSSPEISVGKSALGRETLAAINEELIGTAVEEPTTEVRHKLAVREGGAPNPHLPEANAIEVFEMMTFVARGEVSELSAQSARRAFVEERLLHRLPVSSMSEVDRIDVTPWTVKGTVIVRVWCVVPPAPALQRRSSG